MSTTPKTKKSSSPRPRRVFPAKVKCEAVLAVWSQRRKPSEICRELGVPWQQLNSWQNQALEAMMSRLEPRQAASPKPALDGRMQKLLEKTERRLNRTGKLEKRLESIQQNQPKPPAKQP